MKKICLLFLTILTLLLTSCGEDATQLAKDEFSKYYNGKDEVVLNIEDNLYFENHVLEKESFEPGISYGTMIFYEDLIYYISINSLNKNYRNEYINIYSCNYYGENKKIIYSKEINTNSDIVKKIINDSYYIEYKKDKKAKDSLDSFMGRKRKSTYRDFQKYSKYFSQEDFRELADNITLTARTLKVPNSSVIEAYSEMSETEAEIAYLSSDITILDSLEEKYNAMEVIRLQDEKEREAVAIVNDENSSLAIGKKGQNVKLASRLTKYKIAIKKDGELNEE